MGINVLILGILQIAGLSKCGQRALACPRNVRYQGRQHARHVRSRPFGNVYAKSALGDTTGLKSQAIIYVCIRVPSLQTPF